MLGQRNVLVQVEDSFQKRIWGYTEQDESGFKNRKNEKWHLHNFYTNLIYFLLQIDIIVLQAKWDIGNF